MKILSCMKMKFHFIIIFFFFNLCVYTLLSVFEFVLFLTPEFYREIKNQHYIGTYNLHL